MIERIDPPTAGGETATLTGFLDYFRVTFALKCEGLDPDQLARRAVPPSTLSLLGLARHLAEVERSWFRGFAGESTHAVYYTEQDPDGDFDGARPDGGEVSAAFAYWQLEVEHAREVTAAHGLDDTYRHSRSGESISLRWILVHLIEEYARHCGHADFLREVIDGVTGD